MDGASINTVCYALKGNSRDQGQIPQVEYKVSRHWPASNDVALREALREQYVRSELQWFDDGQLCWQIITFEWVLKEEDGEMVVVPSLPGVEKWETDPAQAHMPSRHQMGLPDPPSYMRFSTDRLVELYPPSEPMPDWLFTGMGVLGSEHLQRFMRKRNERYGILVSWTGGWTHLRCNWLTGNTFSLHSRSRRRHYMNGVFHTKNPTLYQTELRHRLRRIIA
jgi:hypothetical protein